MNVEGDGLRLTVDRKGLPCVLTVGQGAFSVPSQKTAVVDDA